MTHVQPAASYDDIPDFGALYDALPGYLERRDAAFYVEEAVRAKGPVLELGCGTGRVLIPIARAGVSITGLDGSARMLERCRVRLESEPSDVRERVALREGDASDFSFDEKFALVTAPFRVMQHQVTIERQLGMLTSAARHLAPGGRVVFDVFNPNFSYFAMDRSAEAEETPTLTMPDGRSLSRSFRVPRMRLAEQVNEIELIYYVATPAGTEPKRYVQAFEMRWFVRAELEHLVARSGLRMVEVYGDFDRSPLTDSSPEMIVVAELA